jgi:SRSO17 transposase
MLERAVAAKVPFAWFTADEAYGQNRELRKWCEQQDIAYVMATHRTRTGLVRLPAALQPTSPSRPLPQTTRTPRKVRTAIAVLMRLRLGPPNRVT